MQQFSHSDGSKRPAPRAINYITKHTPRPPPLSQVYGYALFKDSREAVVGYPMEGFSEDVAGRSFHHGRFVQRMRHAAAACPGVTAREAFVKKLVNGRQREDRLAR